MPYDIFSLADQLEADRDGNAPDLGWIQESTTHPEPFWAALADFHASARAPRARTRPGERFDLYYDLVIRNLAPDRPAFRWYDRRRGWQALAFSELHARVTRKAGEWAAQKVAPGKKTAIVLPFGPDYVVALLAGLRMGLCVSPLPPLGDKYLELRLTKLAPAHVATDTAYVPLLPDAFKKLVLREGSLGAQYPDRWHTYASGEVCGQFFSPLREPLEKPIELTADDAYLAAVRDGIFAYRLGPGDHLAAPGFHPLQNQPAMLLAALFAGAAFVHLPPEEVRADPKLLLAFPLRSLGVTAALRDVVIGAGLGKVTAWSHWFKNPEEPSDPEAWRAFVKACELDKVPASNLLIDAASGGCILGSLRRPGSQEPKHLPAVDSKVLPVPGKPWALYDLAIAGKEATGDFGLLAPSPAKKPEELGHVLLSKVGREYLYAGTVKPRREGRVYPCDEVVEALGELPFVTGAWPLAVSSGGSAAKALFILLVFTGAEDDAVLAREEPARRDAIARAITTHLGEEFLPDKTLFFPLYARLRGGKLDPAWCEAQYRTGSLFLKSEDPMFRALTALRKRCVNDLTAG